MLPAWRFLVGLLVAGAVLAGCTPVAPPGGTATGTSGAGPVQARAQLAALQVRPWRSMRGYSRARFRHWAELAGRCNTRELVLRRDGRQVRTDSSCRVRGGRWVSPYDGEVVTSAAELDIDHVVPLANAWRSGADSWTDAARERFANEVRLPELIAVTASVNRSKGDQGPEAWKPPETGYWCSYARSWITVKRAYQLSITLAERAALATMLDHC